MYIHDNTSDVYNTSIIILGNSNITETRPDLEKEAEKMWTSGAASTTYGVCLVTFVVIGACLSVFMIVAIVPNRRLRKVRNMLLIHVGITGLLLSFLINLLVAVVGFTGKWFGGNVLCHIFGFILSMITIVTTWTIAALSWDKYHTISSPLHHSFMATAIKIIVCFVVFWVGACVFSLPPLLGGTNHSFHSEKGICFVSNHSVWGKIYIFIFVSIAFYIPLGLMFYCYTHIFKIARTQSSRIAATMIRMANVIQAPIAPPNNQVNGTNNSLSIQGTKALCTIFQLIGAFVLTYIPFSVILVLEAIDPSLQPNIAIYATVTTLFLSAPVVNGLVYGIRNKILRKSFYRYIRRQFHYLCYKDKRRGSVKSFRSSSFRLQKKNGDISQGLRRTQSFPVRGMKRNPRLLGKIENGDAKIPLQSKLKQTLKRPHSFNTLSGNCSLSPREDVC
ncbi:hypothetical protein CHS0354_025387 [Potamilus streckersoni]|uniref:G-protein coupled receptors family 1 profile domain-containing protein n=1 Tax=Potamilus streckersoni TaxID=2493646 RepID=A0AAE0W0A1_9BIVA|nr:hypothetical protein CHS0354_025387 [Potamilus streckersoni]